MIVIPNTKIKVINPYEIVLPNYGGTCTLSEMKLIVPCHKCKHPIDLSINGYTKFSDSFVYDFPVDFYICLSCERESKLKSILHED